MNNINESSKVTKFNKVHAQTSLLLALNETAENLAIAIEIAKDAGIKSDELAGIAFQLSSTMKKLADEFKEDG